MLTQTLYRTVFTGLAIAVTTGLMLQIGLLGALAIETVGFGYAGYALKAQKNSDHFLPAIIAALSTFLASAMTLFATVPYALFFLGLASCGIMGSFFAFILANQSKQTMAIAIGGFASLGALASLAILFHAPGALLMLAGATVVSGISIVTYVGKSSSEIMMRVLNSYIPEEKKEIVMQFFSAVQSYVNTVHANTSLTQSLSDRQHDNGRRHHANF